jgi:hypothetical protein
MGVQVYLLDRRTASLRVGTYTYEIGSLRRFWKLTELDPDRSSEIGAVRSRLGTQPAPLAVMINEVSEIAPVTAGDHPVAAHLVLGWDVDRVSVTDMNWEYLPILGYAVRDEVDNTHTMHEVRDGQLLPVDNVRAKEIGLITQDGKIARHGQPSIVTCLQVLPLIETYAEADCVLSNGQTAKILTSITPGKLPDPTWYEGKRPVDVKTYPAAFPISRSTVLS